MAAEKNQAFIFHLQAGLVGLFQGVITTSMGLCSHRDSHGPPHQHIWHPCVGCSWQPAPAGVSRSLSLFLSLYPPLTPDQ